MSALEQALGGPEIEVVAKATRRRFTVEYKRKILREADGCKTPGAVGALLRREGLYSSHLTTWRAARERGELAGAPKKRGPARRVVDPRDKKIAEQAREISAVAEARRAGRGAGRTPKKSGGVAGNAAGRRDLVMATVTEIGPRLGIAPTCAALGLPRATYYRGVGRREPSPPRRRSPRALGEAERAAVLEQLARAALRGPGARRGLRHAARRGPLSLLGAHDVSHPGRARRGARAARSAPASRLRRPGAAGPPAQRALELGHHQAARARRSGPTSTCT